ncbi:MAG TPA: hypothetical protein VK178_07180 [Opitutaceae bacterium]|nr:hypothetical protein [Opitutaceae bacterium]
MNELEILRRRVEKLESLVRPLMAAQEAGRSSDDKTVAAIADQVGVDIARLQGDERTRAVTAARRVVAKILRTEAGWSIGRVARALRKDHRTVREMGK